MKRFYSALLAVAIALQLVGCQTDPTDVSIQEKSHTFDLSIASTRTLFGEKAGDCYPVYWSEGDRIVVNGITSKEGAISSDDRSRAIFEIEGVLQTPYLITYPYCEATTKEKPMVVFPAEQMYAEGTFPVESVPMCGYVEIPTGTRTLQHLAGVLRFPMVSNIDNIVLDRVVITSHDARIAGEFAVNCKAGTISATNNSSNVITFYLPENFTLSTKVEKTLYISLPATNIGKCTIEFIDSTGAAMSSTWNPSSTIPGGIVREFKTITYKAHSECSLEPFDSYADYFIGTTACCGFVTDTLGNPISDVVMSNGEFCSKTDENGFYELDFDLDSSKFIFASIPSGYKAPNNANSTPLFYYTITDMDRERGYSIANFVFEPISGDPNRYTLLIGADLQPRAKTSSYDRIAFHSLDVTEDFYRDIREKGASITDREVYGMILGDIVHENMSLFANYVTGLKTLGFQMFNVIGNHDHDYSASTDVEAARKFEEYFGPSYYSFNIGKLHYIVLDNIIMAVENGKVQKTGYAYGLTDREWTWLQNDLKYVDKSTTLMVASHIPMFKKDSANTEFQDQSEHGSDYANLLKQYSKVHAWAGHTHRSFNYNYSSSLFSTLKNIEVHTLARSTGELWTNEYNAYGTPRGYTVVEVDGNDVSWYFKPTTYQQAKYVGNDYETVGQPTYALRQWDYDSNGVGIMRSTGKTLDQAHQMSVWKDGDYIYTNVYLWDSKWGTPTFNGSKMSQLSRTHSNAFDQAYMECREFYETSSFLKDVADYLDDFNTPDRFNSIFRIKNTNSTGSGTISVTDRFGNTYTATISW